MASSSTDGLFDRDALESSLRQAHLSCSAMPVLEMPWESQEMAWIFGPKDEPIVPDVMPVLGRVEPIASNWDDLGSGMKIRKSATAYESAISFDSKRPEFLPEGDQLHLVAQKWEAVISINYAASNLGVDLAVHAYDRRVKMVGDIFGGKAASTLNRRLTQISQYIKWVGENEVGIMGPFPVTGDCIVGYVHHLQSNGAQHSTFAGFVQVLTFMKFVLGLECDLQTFKSAWVAGVIRGVNQRRPLRKQSSVLSVCAVQWLEQFLADETRAIVDRYAAGVVLFAIFSRSRFGDLKSISKILIDVPVEVLGVPHVGYLELHSASHKLRAAGNRIGCHLPLIAPVKGLGDRAWGLDFIEVSKLAKMDLTAWDGSRPLLPAPDLLGNWTDRPVTSHEIKKWIFGLLHGCSDWDDQTFTPHGCKATTLAWMAKYGMAPQDRLVLGHHQGKNGVLDVYARDTQSAPLRAMEMMFSSIRLGTFRPDCTRSGLFVPEEVAKKGVETPTYSPSPSLKSWQPADRVLEVPDDDGPVDAPTLEDGNEDSDADLRQGPEEALRAAELDPSFSPMGIFGPDQQENMDELVAISDSETSADSSDESTTSSSPDLEEAVADLATTRTPPVSWKDGYPLFQHVRTKTVHAASMFGNSFLCGRAKTKDFVPFSSPFFAQSMVCSQCDRGTSTRPQGDVAQALTLAIKRAKKS